jgi:hypothetical protein
MSDIETIDSELRLVAAGRETKSCVAMSLLASPSLTSRTTSRSVGVSDSQPLVGRLRWPAAALRVADRLLDRQGRALGPCGFKVLLTHCVSQRGHRGLVARVPDLEADSAHTLPTAVCRAEQPGPLPGGCRHQLTRKFVSSSAMQHRASDDAAVIDQP